MNPRDRRAPGGAELDRQTGEVLSPWFASTTVSPPPASILQGVQTRVPSTRRRAAWRIPDWWLWRRADTERAGFVLATATAVLFLAVVGLTSAGVFIVATTGGPAPVAQAPGAAAASPDAGSEQMAAAASPVAEVATPEAVVATAEPAAATGPDAAAMPEPIVTSVAGTMAAPVLDAEGTSSTPAEGVTAIAGLETTADVAFDDARLSGQQRVISHEYRFGGAGGGSVARGNVTITNDGGSWSGTLESVTPPGRPGALQAVELVGEGGYAGLTALLRYDLGAGWDEPGMLRGVVAAGPMPERADRAGLDVYAQGYKLDEDLLSRHTLRTPTPADQAGLPVAVSGTMAMTYEWVSDDVLSDWWFPEGSLELIPEWMAADLSLDDPRLQLDEYDYEVLLNTNYFQTDYNGALSSGLSRGRTADGGGWSGTVRSFNDPDEPVFLAGRHFIMKLSGTGAYEGLSALLFAYPEPAMEEALAASREEILDSWSVDGMLFVGAFPSYPEAP